MAMVVKCWVVRNSAFSLQCGGLERAFIHFAKPTYHLVKLSEKDRDTPFGDITEQASGLYAKYGWHSDPKMWVSSMSVGNFLGYDNPVSDMIWAEIRKHFHGAPIDDWDNLEKAGKSKIEDFCLELDLEISAKLVSGQ